MSIKLSQRKAEAYRIRELDDFTPLINTDLNENNMFRWYMVETEEDFEVLNNAYGESLKKPSVFPEIICVETMGYNEYEDDAWNYNMTSLKEMTESFWDKLGYRVSFEKVNEAEDRDIAADARKEYNSCIV